MNAQEVRTVLVLGAGTMGRGIAQVAAQAGCQALLYDVEARFVEAGIAAVGSAMAKAVAKGKLTQQLMDATLGRIAPMLDLEAGARACDVVIEAIPEKLDLKRAVFQRLAAAARPEALLATNTSSLSISRIAEAVGDPGRVVGMHFFNPPPVMKLLEVVRGARTSQAAVDLAVALGRRFDKEPIVVKDAPGFASSRLGVCLGLEAIRMVEEGVAAPADIDKAMELGYRHPMGPLRLTDLVGLDVRLAIAEGLCQELGTERFKPPELMRRMVKDGKLGQKTGEGFYRWEQ